MASGFKVGATDLDSIFAPFVSGWPQAGATSYKVGASDLNARYAALSSGTASGTTTHLRLSSTADLNTVFAAIGTTIVAVTNIVAVSASTAAGSPSGTVTSNAGGTNSAGSNTVTASKGKQSGYSYTWTIASGSGVSFPGQGTPSSTVSSTVTASTTNSGTFFCSVSDGNSTTNTNTVSWSLQNTSVGTPSTFTPLTIGGGATWWSVAFGLGLFVMVGTGGIMSSPDGATWTQRAAGLTNFRKIIFSSTLGLFIAIGGVGGSASTYANSSNGTTWSAALSIAGNTGAKPTASITVTNVAQIACSNTAGTTSANPPQVFSATAANVVANSWTLHAVSGANTKTGFGEGPPDSGAIGSVFPVTDGGTTTSGHLVASTFIVTTPPSWTTPTPRFPTQILIDASGTNVYAFNNTTNIGTITVSSYNGNPMNLWVFTTNGSAALSGVTGPTFCTANGYFFACGSNGASPFFGAVAFTNGAPDTGSWTTSTTGATAAFVSINQVAFGNNTYVAVGGSGYVGHT